MAASPIRPSRRGSSRGLLLALLGTAGAVALALAAGLGGDESAGADAVGAFDGRSPRVSAGERVRILVELRRPSLGERLRAERLTPTAQRAYVRSLEGESAALESALEAKGIELGDSVTYARTWTGFAATVDTDDVAQVGTLGARVEQVRRFYPAARPAPGLLAQQRPDTEAAGPAPAGPGPHPRAAVAMIDSGVEVQHPDLRGRVEAGPDVLGPDRGRRPAARRGDAHATAVAGVLAAALPRGERVLAIRAAGPQRDAETGTVAEFARSDQLLSGFERAIDPDGDGDIEDRPRVVLVGLNAPYAGFARSPEARAAASTRGAGVPVVAPAGNEGPGEGRFGSVGSPAAAPDALAAGALEGGGTPAAPSVRLGLATRHGRAVLDGVLLSGEGKPLRAPAAALVGPSQAAPEGGGRATGARLLQYFDVDARPRARGALVVVASRPGRGPTPAAVAQTARAAGAAGLVVCRPGDGPALRPLPRAAAGTMPVLGLEGGAARRALELTRSSGGAAFVSAAEPRVRRGEVRPAPTSSRGPSYALELKPDLAAPGSALSAAPGGGRRFVSGTSVAAARVAAVAAQVREPPGQSPATAADRLVGALVGTASTRGAPLAAGAGAPAAGRAADARFSAEPSTLSFGRLGPRPAGRATRELSFSNLGPAPLRLQLEIELRARGFRARVSPRRLTLPARGRVRARVSMDAPSAAAFATGRVVVRSGRHELSVPLGAASGPPPPAPIGPLRLVRERGEVRGVRFSAGSVRPHGGALEVSPIAQLVLALEPRGEAGSSRSLTPPGGATELLPGEYAFSLTRDLLDELSEGSYRFAVRARGPAEGARLSRRSAPFEIGR